MPFGASAQSGSYMGSQTQFRNPTMARYQNIIDKYQVNNPASPFRDPEDVPVSFYMELPHPWNVAPPANAERLTEWRKLEGSAPRFDSREETYTAWRNLFIPAVHQVRAKILWKAILLARDLSPISLFAWLKVVAKNGQTSYRAKQRLAKPAGKTGTEIQFTAHAQLCEELSWTAAHLH